MSDQPTLQFPAAPEPPARPARGWHIAVIALSSVLVVLLPVFVYLLLRGGNQESAAPGDAAPSASSSSPSPTSPTPSASRAPDGRISLDRLGNSTITVPAWPADNVQGPSGRQRFQDGVVHIRQPEKAEPHRPPTGVELVILGVTYGDVDRDGSDETVAEIGCLIEGGSKQLVALDRNASGAIVTMGRVVATTGEIRDIRSGSARVGAGGVVTVRVGDYQNCCGDETPPAWQDRGYGWHGGRFRQVSGPARMTANPSVTETSLSTGRLVLGPAVDGYRHGTLTVTVRHGWGTRPATVAIEFFPAAGLERAGSAWPPVATPPSSPGFVVTVAAPPARGTATYTFAFRRPAAASGGTLDLEISGAIAGHARLAEAIPWNNGATVAIAAID